MGSFSTLNVPLCPEDPGVSLNSMDRSSTQCTNTILLVDDDAALRSLAGSYLTQKGYNVVSCRDAEDAATVVNGPTRIDLLITDVDMPCRSGMDLGAELKHLRPTVPVLLISGGFLTGESSDRVRASGWNLLDKPFRLPELLASVHQLLDKPPEA